MRAGVLIFGSLAWDELPLRVRWREGCLEFDRAEEVAAPIRYGRVSPKRGETYTMVFSAGCVESGAGTGIGLAVPFRRAIDSPEHLLEEATRLWGAESDGENNRTGAYSAEWGSVGLLPNPDSEGVGSLLPAWAEAVSASPHYAALHTADGEAPILSATTGLASFPWPRVTATGDPLSLELLLLTATDPAIVAGKYATPSVVAEAWKTNPERMEYFLKNREYGIQTAQDQDIARALGLSLALVEPGRPSE